VAKAAVREAEAGSAAGEEREKLEALLGAGEEAEAGSSPGEEREELEALLRTGEEAEGEEKKVGEAAKSNGDEG
jgi:hypothetical protein